MFPYREKTKKHKIESLLKSVKEFGGMAVYEKAVKELEDEIFYV